MSHREIPAKMAFDRPVIEKLVSLSNDYGLSRQEMAMSYIKSEVPNAHVIFDAEIASQVRDNMTDGQKEIPKLLGNQIRTIFADVDEQILNPSLWPC